MAMPWALFQSQQLGASAFLPTSQPLQGGGPLLTVPSHVLTTGQAPPGQTINAITIPDDPRDTVAPLHAPLPPHLWFTHLSTAGVTRWLQTHSMPPTDHPQWWYDCIPHIAIILKKSKDDPVPGGKHNKQWSGILFCQQTNVKSVDLLAVLGGVHLSIKADLCMGKAPSLPLGNSWCFLLGKTAWPFLSGVCN